VKRCARSLSLAALCIALASCTTPLTSSTTQSPSRVSILGSGTCTPLVRTLTEAYPERHDLDFEFMPGLRTSTAVRSVAQGECEIGAVARELNAEEQSLGLEYTPISKDGLVVATHPSVTVDGLTTAQLLSIYTGKCRNWAELGGPDLPIFVLDRNDDEAAKQVLRRYVLGDAPVTDEAIVLFYEQDMAEALEKTPGAIGFLSLGQATARSPHVSIKSLDGVAPSIEAIESGRYRMVRPLGVVTAPDAPPRVREFVKWAAGPDAALVMEKRGYAPIAHVE